MAKPRVFVSSTFYDLKYVREGLSAFIKGMGYEPVLFEKGDIPFQHERALDESCYAEVDLCHILVMIIGGRYGSAESNQDTTIEQVKSITRKEYERARERDIPIFIFVEKNVLAEHKTYIRNKGKKDFEYAYVDNVEIYKMLDDIVGQRRNNLVREFDEVENIVTWLKEQWAGLFADFLSKKNEQARLTSLSEQIYSLQDVALTIKNYSEEVIRATHKTGSSKIISDQEEMLRKKMVSRFSKEGMISYLRSEYKIKKSPVSIFSAFEKADNLEAFLTGIGMSVREIKKFDDEVGSRARRDFGDMKAKYVYDSPESEALLTESPD